ncbi:hypothetical protein PMAYCL1PPCAC_28953, partial [Pristionchus mayeri]
FNLTFALDGSSGATGNMPKSSDDIYEVEAVVGKRHKKGELEYRLKWKGYNEYTWVKLRYCTCKKMIDRFERQRNESGNMMGVASSSSSSRKKPPGQSLDSQLAAMISTHPVFIPIPMEAIEAAFPNVAEMLDALPYSSRRLPTIKKKEIVLQSNTVEELTIWGMESYEGWMNENGQDFDRLLEGQDVEIFMGKEIEKVVAHYPYGQKPFFIIKTEIDPSQVTSIRDVIHGIECYALCRLFPKTFANYTNFMAYTFRLCDDWLDHPIASASAAKNGRKK